MFDAKLTQSDAKRLERDLDVIMLFFRCACVRLSRTKFSVEKSVGNTAFLAVGVRRTSLT